MKIIFAILILFFNVCKAELNARAIEKIHCGIFKGKPLLGNVKVVVNSHSFECLILRPDRGILFTHSKLTEKMQNQSQNGREGNHSTLSPTQIEAIKEYQSLFGNYPDTFKCLSEMFIYAMDSPTFSEILPEQKSNLAFFYVRTTELFYSIFNSHLKQAN